MPPPKISIIIPVLNEYHNLIELLLPLNKTSEFESSVYEIIVVDGGSNDGSVILAKQFADKVIETKKGRAVQLNAGAKIAKSDKLWFIHADSLLKFKEIDKYIKVILDNQWGRFNVCILAKNPLLKLVSLMINLRSRISNIATGDQGIFVAKNLFFKIGGYKNQNLMEDIELCKQLKRHQKPHNSSMKIITSARKWQQNGIFSTILLMWRLRFQYFIGTNPDKLAKQYYR